MNICLRSGLGALALLALAGCASGGGVASYPADRNSSPSADHSGIDHEYVSAVERQAQRNGAFVQWINPPRERALASVSP
ncbi:MULTISPECIES: hypothetical protein [unclassified Luteimonas]|uniref:hypothetical protein n=1 Tax=unclassified Luteimonas TaxID=2629088 RepID=UPI0016015CE2|nr:MULTISPECIES: hypothetical protein [unclassified Luteimonas]MBB1472512.1 hypothetical protein [Luteimonas sp. MC1782]MBB6598768.1 hypothetical protein [Luteimonas sp. MC1825]QOC88929.1 hypothetical protein IDM46_04080 [Luteimonas sp. MC1825]